MQQSLLSIPRTKPELKTTSLMLLPYLAPHTHTHILAHTLSEQLAIHFYLYPYARESGRPRYVFIYPQDERIVRARKKRRKCERGVVVAHKSEIHDSVALLWRNAVLLRSRASAGKILIFYTYGRGTRKKEKERISACVTSRSRVALSMAERRESRFARFFRPECAVWIFLTAYSKAVLEEACMMRCELYVGEDVSTMKEEKEIK